MPVYPGAPTGQPKGAELRHRNIYDNTLVGAELFPADLARPDTYLCVLPLFHSFGQTVIQNGAIAFGGTIVMLPRFEATAALRLMVAHHVTFFGQEFKTSNLRLAKMNLAVHALEVQAARIAHAECSIQAGEIQRMAPSQRGRAQDHWHDQQHRERIADAAGH